MEEFSDMAFGDTAKNFLSNSLGNVEKAIIRVVDDGEKEGGSGGLGEDSVRLSGPEESASLKGSMDDAFSSDTIKQQTAIEDLASALADNESMFASGKQFKVQFNPATLHLRASGGGYVEIKNFLDISGNKSNDTSYSYGPSPFSVLMDVDLIFNKVNPNDAFLEMLQSPGTFKGAGNTVLSLLDKTPSYSVQNEIEGLIAATRCFSTCLLSFNWGKLCYSGVLQNLEANYTMFNPKGEPIAGTVHLSMILLEEGVNEKNMGKWYRAYNEAFKDPVKLASFGSSVGGSAFSNFTF